MCGRRMDSYGFLHLLQGCVILGADMYIISRKSGGNNDGRIIKSI